MSVVPPPRRRRLPVLLLSLLVFVVLAVVGVDRLIVWRAQTGLAQQVGAALDAPVQVHIGGPAAGLRLVLLGEVTTLRLEATGVPVRDPAVTIDQLEVTIDGLRLDGEVPIAGTGTFIASFSQPQVQAAVPPGLGRLVRLGETALLLDIGITDIPLDVTVVDDALRLEVPGDPPFIDQLVGDVTMVSLMSPDGIVVTAAQVQAGVLRLTGTLDPVIVGAG